MNDQTEEVEVKHSLAERIGSAGQVIIGEIEALAGVINADPLAQAEGKFNIEVGSVREQIEEDLEEEEEKKSDDARATD